MPTAAELNLILRFRDEATAAIKQATQGIQQSLRRVSESMRDAGLDLRRFSREALQLGGIITGPFVLAFRTASQRVPEVRDQLAILGNEFIRLQVSIAQATLPVLKILAGVLQQLVTWFTSLPEQTRRSVTEFTLLSGILLILVGTVTRIVALLGLLGSALTAMGATAALTKHPILALLAAIIGITAAVVGWQKAAGFLNRTLDEMEAKLKGVGAVAGTFKDQMAVFWTQFSNVGVRSAQLVVGGITGLEDRFTSLFQGLITRSTSAKEAFKQFALSILQMIAQMIAKFIAMSVVLFVLQRIPGMSALLAAADSAALASRKMRINVGQPEIIRHGGGLVPSFQAGGEVPAMLESGEFVVRRSVAQRNLGVLDRLNRGEASGGGGVQNIFIIHATDADSFKAKLAQHADLIESMFQRAMRRNSGPMRESVRI